MRIRATAALKWSKTFSTYIPNFFSATQMLGEQQHESLLALFIPCLKAASACVDGKCCSCILKCIVADLVEGDIMQPNLLSHLKEYAKSCWLENIKTPQRASSVWLCKINIVFSIYSFHNKCRCRRRNWGETNTHLSILLFALIIKD